MHQHILVEIGQKLRKIRKEKGLTVQNVASRAGVSKGLISRIENNRTIPSLPVLISVIKSLEAELNSFFEDIDLEEENEVLVIKASQLVPNESEDGQGCTSYPLLQKKLSSTLLQTTIIEMEPGFRKESGFADGYVLKYIIDGQINYQIDEVVYHLSKGDSIYFKSKNPNISINVGQKGVKILEFGLLQA